MEKEYSKDYLLRHLLEGWHHSKEKNVCGNLICECGCTNPGFAMKKEMVR